MSFLNFSVDELAQICFLIQCKNMRLTFFFSAHVKVNLFGVITGFLKNYVWPQLICKQILLFVFKQTLITYHFKDIQDIKCIVNSSISSNHHCYSKLGWVENTAAPPYFKQVADCRHTLFKAKHTFVWRTIQRLALVSTLKGKHVRRNNCIIQNQFN